MGRQVNFYMTNEEEKRFIEFTNGTGDIVILADTSPTQELRDIKTLPEPFSVPSWAFLLMYNRNVKPEPILEYVPQQKHYVVERFQSPVVEFSRSFVKNDVMRAGRIWAEFKFYDEHRNLVAKDPMFQKWFNQLANWIRKNYKLVDSLTYAGPEAVIFRAKGGIWETLAGQRF